MNEEPNLQQPASSLPVLPQVRIESPCSMNWDSMDGSERARFCGSCQKHVHNLSEMKAEEVSKLLGSGQTVCVKMCQRSDGTIVTKENSQPAFDSDATISRRNWLAHLGALAAGVLAVFSMGCRDGVEQPELMGTMTVPPTAEAPMLMGEVEVMGGARANPNPTAESVPQNDDPSGNLKTMMGKVAPPESQSPQ